MSRWSLCPGSLETMAKPVPVVLAARIIRGIAEGIRYAHARRCIHRDIKPQNILLTDEMVPKITDWGISKVLEENTKNTTIAGFSLVVCCTGTDRTGKIRQYG